MNKVNNEQKNDVKKIKPRVNGETRRKKIANYFQKIVYYHNYFL